MMKCEICLAESNIIYATRKNGLICNICHWKLYDSDEEKLKQELEKIEMMKKYGVL